MGGWRGQGSWSREQALETLPALRMALLEALVGLWQVEAGGGEGGLPGGDDWAGLGNGCDSRERGGCLWTHPRGRRQDCGNQGSGGGRDETSLAKPRIPGRGWDAGERGGESPWRRGKDKDRAGEGGGRAKPYGCAADTELGWHCPCWPSGALPGPQAGGTEDRSVGTRKARGGR